MSNTNDGFWFGATSGFIAACFIALGIILCVKNYREHHPVEKAQVVCGCGKETND